MPENENGTRIYTNGGGDPTTAMAMNGIGTRM